MLIRALALAGCLAAGLVLVRAQEPGQQRPTFRADAHFVTVDAYPLKDGKVVEGLRPEDFIVEEDGRPQTIEEFEFISGADAAPSSTLRDPNTVTESRQIAADARTRAFVVYLDVKHVSLEGARAARVPLVTTLNSLIGENDLYGVITPRQAPSDLTFARKTLTVDDMLTRYWYWGERDMVYRSPLEKDIEGCFAFTSRGGKWYVHDGVLQRRLADVLIDRAREEETLQHLDDLVAYLGHLREGRTSVLLFTEGWRLFNDEGGLMAETGKALDKRCDEILLRLANVGLQQRFRDVTQHANRANVTFYPVNPIGLATFDLPLSADVIEPDPFRGDPIEDSPLRQNAQIIGDRAGSLKSLATATDGVAVVSNDLKGGLRRVTDMLRSYYLLGYYSTNKTFDGKYRRISVKVKPPGVDVTARRGYAAPTAAERAASLAAAAAPVDTSGPSPVEEALDTLARIRPSAELFVYGALGMGPAGQLTIVGELSNPLLAQGGLSKGGALSFTVTDAAGAQIGTAEVALAASARGGVATVAVPAGTNAVTVTAKLRVADATYDARTEVRRDADGLFGAPLVYRATPSSRSPLLAVAGFDFRRTERVHIEWPISGPLDRREGRLLSRNGEPKAVNITLTEREVDGRLMLGLDALLAPLGPGDYVIEVTGASGAATARRLIGIRVSN